jgi:hypothetical protein
MLGALIPAAAAAIVSAQTGARSGAAAQIAPAGTPPETFVATAQATNAGATASATVTIQINRYTSETDRTRITEALRTGGYPGFLPALRRAQDVGYIEVNDKRTIVRWARQQPTEKGRTISVITESPLLFLGGASPNAKPREGYEVAVILFDVDTVGLGAGTMAAAARVRPGGETGVQIDDYADTPIKLTTVRKTYR